MSHRVLVIDDETSILNTLDILLRREGFQVTVRASGRDALDRWDESPPDVVLSDIRMPGFSGMDVLAAVRDRDPHVPVILMTAQASLQSAIEAVNRGAFYYLQKPFANDDLVALCRRAAETSKLKHENVALKKEIKRRDTSGRSRPVGKNRAFLDVVRLAETVAPTDSTVLITGESGTGKEVLARYIHQLSDRAENRFVSINCGALPESLLESELFGHVKGSFTGAIRDKEGLLVAARGGTFFLDEVGEMSPSLQVKFLRTLQEREVVPVGSTTIIETDVRVIASTNRDLEQGMRNGTFRSDLYYRLNVISLHMPPLRDRADDVPVLTEHFLSRFGNGQGLEIHDDALERLSHYDWPGNVRELENALERAAVLSGGKKITVEHLPGRVIEPPLPSLVADRPAASPTLDTIERAYVLWVLDAEGGNKARAAEVLGIDPSTLYRKLSRYGVSD
jgi:DNA-binding NtrC family response regulator